MATPGSSDEGEVMDYGGGKSKATTLSHSQGAGVDRLDRHRARSPGSRSPDYGRSPNHRQSDAARRSPSPRGHKRPRDDRDRFSGSSRLDNDNRRFRVHYEDPRDKGNRSRLSYDDGDRPTSHQSGSALHYDDRDRGHGRGPQRDRSRDRKQDRNADRYADKRPRNRSRSPYRNSREGGRDYGGVRRDDERGSRNGQNIGRPSGTQNGSNQDRWQRGAQTETKHMRPGDARPHADVEMSHGTAAHSRSADDDKDFEAEKPVDVNAEIERRRRKREELLAKSRGGTPMLVQALQTSAKAAESPSNGTRASTPMAIDTPGSVVSSPASPAPPNLYKDQNDIAVNGNPVGQEEDGPSAADYDPTIEMREDELRDELRHGQIGPHGERLPADQKANIAPFQPDEELKQPDVNDDEDGFDMFAEEIDEDKLAAPKSAPMSTVGDDRKLPATIAQAKAGGILEGDDLDGYYKIRIGELMDGRYQVQSTLGKGMFSGVARAVDVTTKELVAVKMMRNNDALRKGGFTEIAILQKLNEADPDNRKHIVKFERHFEHKDHLCLAFENLSYNLREVLKKFGNNVGINLGATRTYAHQMFVALAHMRKCSIVHADLKPDNILTDEKCAILKICDLGTAIDKDDAATAHTEVTPYLVSRFYRAPEIMLGMPYEYAIDMWSIGCTLYEMYTGKILFTGSSNNQMLKTIIEIRGKFSAKLYKRGELAPLHFDEMGNFISVEQDKVLNKTTVRVLPVVKQTRDLRTRLMAASPGLNETTLKDLNHFIDLLERCLALNPDKRITPVEALKHPFFTSKTQLAFK